MTTKNEPILAPVLSPASLAPVEMPASDESQAIEGSPAASARRKRFVRLVVGIMGLCGAIVIAAIGATAIGHTDDAPTASVATASIAAALTAYPTATTRVESAPPAPLAVASPKTSAPPGKKKGPLRAQPVMKQRGAAKPAPPTAAGSPSPLEGLMRPVSHGSVHP